MSINPRFNLATTTDPSKKMTYAGASTNYLYNKDNELVSSNDFTISRSKHRGLDVRVTDGVYVQESHYNLYGELSRQSDGVVGLKVYRNKNAQIVKKVEKLQNQRRKVYHYTYDERGRLTQACRVGIPAHQGCEEYAYNANGNRATATVNGTTVTASYTLDDNLVVYGDNTYLYDEDGYLKTKTTPQGTTTYTYGTLGELLEVTTPTKTITYRHNANNQRVAKLINGTVVEKYLWADLTTLLAIYDANDTLKQRFEYADGRMPVAMTQGSTKYYLHYDQVGSLRAISDTQMNIVKEITYDTYGNILSDTNSSLKVPFGFAGGLYDSDTKLTRFGYRDYDAYVGKWTAKDPIGFSGGDSNLYGYVLGDPVDFVDPSGKIAIIDDVLIIGIAFLGAWAIHESIPHVQNLINDISIDLPQDPPDDPPNERDCDKNRDGCPEIISECVSEYCIHRALGSQEWKICMAKCVPKRCHRYHEWGQPPYSDHREE